MNGACLAISLLADRPAARRRVILDNVPVGKSVYLTVDDSAYHYRDTRVEWLGSEPTTSLQPRPAARRRGDGHRLRGRRLPAIDQWRCDAAGDSVSNGGTEGKTSTSADGDGGYLAERLQAYAATGGPPV
jgi:hypothetical protein